MALSYRTIHRILLLQVLLLLSIPPWVRAAEDAGRFKQVADGTIIDQRTGLMWTAQDNGYDLNWTEAYLYCEELQTAGFSDWRLPSGQELKSLYLADSPNSKGLYINPFFQLSDVMYWSSAQHACKAFCLDFSSGQLFKMKGSRRGVARALAVRSVKSDSAEAAVPIPDTEDTSASSGGH